MKKKLNSYNLKNSRLVLGQNYINDDALNSV